MPANTAPIFPLTPIFLQADLSAASACTSRIPTVSASLASAAVYAVELKAANVSSPAGASGRRIDRVQVKGIATAIAGATTASTIIIWADDGYKGWPVAEISIPAITPSAAIPSVDVSQSFTTLVLSPGAKLWASCTVAGASAAHALAVFAWGGDY